MLCPAAKASAAFLENLSNDVSPPDFIIDTVKAFYFEYM